MQDLLHSSHPGPGSQNGMRQAPEAAVLRKVAGIPADNPALDPTPLTKPGSCFHLSTVPDLGQHQEGLRGGGRGPEGTVWPCQCGVLSLGSRNHLPPHCVAGTRPHPCKPRFSG